MGGSLLPPSAVAAPTGGDQAQVCVGPPPAAVCCSEGAKSPRGGVQHCPKSTPISTPPPAQPGRRVSGAEAAPRGAVLSPAAPQGDPSPTDPAEGSAPSTSPGRWFCTTHRVHIKRTLFLEADAHWFVC